MENVYSEYLIICIPGHIIMKRDAHRGDSCRGSYLNIVIPDGYRIVETKKNQEHFIMHQDDIPSYEKSNKLKYYGTCKTVLKTNQAKYLKDFINHIYHKGRRMWR